MTGKNLVKHHVVIGGKHMDKRILLTGYGTVGQEFCRLVLEKQDIIARKYGFRPVLVGIRGSQAGVYDPHGLRIKQLLEFGKGSTALVRYAEAFGGAAQNLPFDADVLVESTPSQLEDGGPALGYIRDAISARMHVVAISKGALVTHYQQIMAAAREQNVNIKYSGATAAALPTLDIGQVSLAGTQLEAIEGILNGTTNYILTRMHEEELSFTDALQHAQEKGIAEANPSLDTSGIDSACKILLLSNSLLGTTLSLDQVEIAGIEGVNREDIRKAKSRNAQLKLMAKAQLHPDHIKVSVSPSAIEHEHPLYGVNGTNKAVRFQTVEMGSIVCSGGASHPRGAAAAALKDLINIFRRDTASSCEK